MGMFVRELANCGTTTLEEQGPSCDECGLGHQLSSPNTAAIHLGSWVNKEPLAPCEIYSSPISRVGSSEPVF